MGPISDHVAGLIEGGSAAWLATAGADRRPHAARVTGARFAEDRKRVSIFVPIEQAGRTFINLSLSPRVAVFFCRVTDYRAVQVKGAVLEVRPARDDERPILEEYVRQWTEDCVQVGLGRDLMEGLAYWPSARVELEVRAVFEQTPGARAGAAL